MILGRLTGWGAGTGRDDDFGAADAPGKTGLLLLLVLEWALGPPDEEGRYPDAEDDDLVLEERELEDLE